MIPLIIRIYLKAFKRGIEYGPYNMNYFIYTILNRPYHMVHIKWVVHMIWLILNAPYKMKYTQTLYDMRIKFSIKIDCFIYCKNNNISNLT